MWIEAEFTGKGREIQKERRNIAREEETVRYQKLEIDDKTIKWENKG